jgi:DNA-binding MarR family transcriptional regulator
MRGRRRTIEPARGQPGADAKRLLASFRAVVRRFSVSERADVSCCGMTIAQAATLETLRSEGSMRLGSLCTRLGITPSTLTRNLARLEERGLITRVSDPEDSRASFATLTDAGRKAATRLERQEEEFAQAILERLPARERRPALASLERLLVAVREATESCCPGAFDHLIQALPKKGSDHERRSA